MIPVQGTGYNGFTMDSASSANRSIARAAGTIMLPFVLSNLLGLARTILMSNAFGTGPEVDAFNAATKIPDILFALVAGGALASAFIPTYTGLLVNKRRAEAWRLASAIANLVFLILVVVSVLAAWFAPWIVRHILVPDFTLPQQDLTVALMRVTLPSAAIFGISGLLMGILNANKVFLYPALAPSMYWLGIIFGVVALSPSMGIYGPAWGVVVGAGLHLLVQLPGLVRVVGKRFFLTLGLRLPDVREVARLMGPRLFGVAVVQLNSLVNANLASGINTGSLTAIIYGFAIMTMPEVVIAQSIAIASLPTFSAQVARGRLDEMQSSLAATLRSTLLLALPASIGLIMLRTPLVAAFLQRGEFDVNSTQMVAWALLWYAAGLVGHSVVEISSRAFYALHDTRTPVLVGAIAMSLNLGFSFLFMRLFIQVGWAPHGGLALANSLATFLEMIALSILMRGRLGGLGGRALLTGIGQAGVGTGIMALVVAWWMGFALGQPDWLVLAGGVLLGGGVYTLALALLHVPEIDALFGMVWRQTRRLMRLDRRQPLSSEKPLKNPADR